ncbi:hypothetical protein B9Z55_012519 [Caenorhabditis nigoni]|uniref:Sdz-33 F-box domain-containing protein n=1 Tax=Caenorhabditis nigoni TaxID=1611254 RepID=A0A2G5TXQ3_9PELO|nr:hypothetical protein B9Z55_012519 [Caenorhabditis nigoni]
MGDETKSPDEIDEKDILRDFFDQKLSIEQETFELRRRRLLTFSKSYYPMTVTIPHEKEPSPQCSINQGRNWVITHDKRKKSAGYPHFESILTGPKVSNHLFLNDDGNATEDLKKMTEHICEVFCSPICEIQIDKQSLIEWLIKFQPLIRYVSIRKDVVTSFESLDRLFQNVRVTERFLLGSIKLNGNSQYTEPIPFRSITITGSSWVTLPSILNGTNSIIRLHGSKLSPKDINTILKEWQMGFKLYNLEFLEVDISTLLNLDSFPGEVLKDLSVTRNDGNDGRPTTVKIHDEYIITLPLAHIVFNLARNDGMIGSFFAYRVNEGERMMIIFYFQVWSKQS